MRGQVVEALVVLLQPESNVPALAPVNATTAPMTNQGFIRPPLEGCAVPKDARLPHVCNHPRVEEVG